MSSEKEETKPSTESKPAPAPKKEETKPSTESKPAPAPKKEEPELPQFEKGMTDRITERFGEKTEIAFVLPNRIGINVEKENIKEVAEFIRDELNFDHAESVTGIDYPESKVIEVVYHLGSYSDPQLSQQILTLSTKAPREDVPNPGNDSTKLPSLRDVFYSVEFHERECFEMLGVYFEGHPDNRRLLLPEDWADLPPLRKDFRSKGR